MEHVHKSDAKFRKFVIVPVERLRGLQFSQYFSWRSGITKYIF